MIDDRLFRGNCYVCSLFLLNVNSLLKITTSFYISYFVKTLFRSSLYIDTWIYRNNNHVKIKQLLYNYN